MKSGPARVSWPMGLVVVAAGVGLACAPAGLQARLGGILRDGLVPGQQLVRTVAERFTTAPRRDRPAETADAAKRGLELEVAQLRSRVRELESPPLSSGSIGDLAEGDGRVPVTADDRPLLVARGVPARVLAGFAGQQWRRLATLDKGRVDGIEEAALVLEGDGPLIDVGTDRGVGDRDLLMSGRHVVGQIAQSGRYSSIVRPITAAEFRGAARLARRSPAGLSFGSVGTLRGTGDDLCELVRILPNEPVEPGDLVVTLSRETGDSRLWVYGVVETATLSDNALEWTIRVRPAERWEGVDAVHVVRLEANPERTAALPTDDDGAERR